MSVQEQQKLKEKYYGKAMRYMDKAKECLQKSQKDGKYYRDAKYVKMACGTAYNGLLVAFDGFFILKNIEIPKGKKRRSIKFYHNNFAQLDKKTLTTLNNAYKILHLWGYYDGIESANIIREGFEEAYTLIDKIKPATHINN